MSVKKAVVVDPNPLWRKATELVLRLNQVEVADTTDSLGEASRLIGVLRPDLAVIEPDQQEQDPQEWLRAHRQRYPTMQVIVFSGRDDPGLIGSMLANGAAAYVLKSAQPIEVGAVLRQLDERRSIYFRGAAPGQETEGLAKSLTLQRTGLTRREQEILRLVAEGASNKAMARHLWLTEQTIKFHLSNIYRKLNVKNRTQASRWAHQYDLAPNT